MVTLFEQSETKGGAIPTSNEMILGDQFLKMSEEHKKILTEKTKKYYRAIGRIMFHSIVRGEPLSSLALPSFYRNGKSGIFVHKILT